EPPPPATHDDEHGADEGEEQRRQLPDDGPVPWMCPCSLKGSASTVEPPELTFGAASCRSRRESSRRFSGIRGESPARLLVHDRPARRGRSRRACRALTVSSAGLFRRQPDELGRAVIHRFAFRGTFLVPQTSWLGVTAAS